MSFTDRKDVMRDVGYSGMGFFRVGNAYDMKAKRNVDTELWI